MADSGTASSFRLATSAPAKKHPAWLGGAAAMMAVVVTHPIDQTKVRSQVQQPRRGMLDTAGRTIKASGVRGLWTGLSGSLLRQGTYGVARFGVYAKLKEGSRFKGNSGLAINGAIAGFFAGIVGAPAELVMVRMCSDGVKPESQRFGYRNAIQGLSRVAREEGLSNVMRGWQATTLRSMIMNATQLSCYDIIKSRLLRTGYFDDRYPLHLLTATLGGTIAVTCCAPVDVIKSRIQSSVDNKTTASRIIAQSLRKEGVSVLFRGWLPAWLRMTPTTTLTFVLFEQLKKIF